MSLVVDIEQNRPPPIIESVNASINIPVHRTGNFYDQKIGPGCGMTCFWNGGGYYMENFVCGQTYPSGSTFYCCSDCHRKIGESKRIFLSYRWCDVEIADKIAGCARGAGIDVLRDVNEMGFLDAISGFMESAGESRYVVAVMTEPYFRSRYCMYEFCQLVESALPIRTIPVMLGDEDEPGIDEKRQQYWRDRHGELIRAIDGIEEEFSGYLQAELDLLARIPNHLADFFTRWRAEERPKGKRWLAANCRYLVSAIKTTFRPSEEDAANWTYTNPTVRGERADDAPPGANWVPEPFHLHSFSETESNAVTRITRARELILDIHHEDSPTVEPQPGVHLVLVEESGLGSLPFCNRIFELQEHRDVTLVPMFLDEALQRPIGEVALLRQWHHRLRATADEKERGEIEIMLRRFGPMIEGLRDTLVPSADHVFAE